MAKRREIKVVDGKVKTTIRLPVDLYWAFQKEAVARKLPSDEAGYTTAVELWLATPAKDSDPSPGIPSPTSGSIPSNSQLSDINHGNPDSAVINSYHGLLDTILQGGHRGTMQAILRALAKDGAYGEGESHIDTEEQDEADFKRVLEQLGPQEEATRRSLEASEAGGEPLESPKDEDIPPTSKRRRDRGKRSR